MICVSCVSYVSCVSCVSCVSYASCVSCVSCLPCVSYASCVPDGTLCRRLSSLLKIEKLLRKLSLQFLELQIKILSSQVVATGEWREKIDCFKSAGKCALYDLLFRNLRAL